MSHGRKWHELPHWLSLIALFLCGSAFVASSFHPALRHERGLALILLCGGLVGTIGSLVAAGRWAVAIGRGEVPASALSESQEQLDRDVDASLAEAHALLSKREGDGSDPD